MSVETIPDSDLRPEQKKKTELQKPWFNWWNFPGIASLDLLTGKVTPLTVVRVMQPDPFASKDIAETAAYDFIAKHTECCQLSSDNYIGAYQEGTSPQ